MRFTCAITVVLALLPRLAAADASAPPAPLTVDWVVRQVLDHYPEVQAKHSEALAAQARVPAAGALDDPDVGVMLDNWPANALNSSGLRRAQTMVDLSQKLPWPGKRAQRTRIARADAALAHLMEIDHHVDLIAQARLAFYDYWLASERLRRAQDEYRLLRALAPAVAIRTPRAQPMPRDLDLEAADLRSEILDFESQQIDARARLNAFVGRAPDDPLPAPQLPDFSHLPARAALLDQATRQGVALRAAGEAVTRAERLRALARSETHPDFTLFGRYAFATPDGMPASFRVGVSVNVPLWAHRKQDQLTAAATDELTAAQATRATRAREVARDVTAAYEDARLKREAVTLYDSDILPRREQLLQATLSRYRTGRVDVGAVIDAYQGRFRSQLLALKARADYAKARATLDKAVGVLNVPMTMQEGQP